MKATSGESEKHNWYRDVLL